MVNVGQQLLSIKNFDSNDRNYRAKPIIFNKRVSFLTRKSVEFFSIFDSSIRVFTSLLVNALRGAVRRVLKVADWKPNKSNMVWCRYELLPARDSIDRELIELEFETARDSWMKVNEKLLGMNFEICYILEWSLQRNFIDRSWKLMVRTRVEEQRERFLGGF